MLWEQAVSNIFPRVSLTPGMVSDCMASICFGRTEGKDWRKGRKGKNEGKQGGTREREESRWFGDWFSLI